jgi:two-component system sensor histidine kinase UhpB
LLHNKSLLPFLLFTTYGLAWIVGWHFSVNFESFKGLVSIFLPAGVRLSFLLLVPRKHWPIIIFSEIAAITLINSTLTSFSSWISQVVGTVGPIGVYALCVRQFLVAFGKSDPASVQNILYLGLWTVVAAIMTQLVMSSAYYLQGTFDFDVFASFFFSYALGDLVAITLFVPLVFVIQYLAIHRMDLDRKRFIRVFVIALLLAAASLFGLITYPEYGHFIKVLIFVPVVLSGYRYGWIGASWAIMLSSFVVIASSLMVINFEEAIDAQLYLIYIATSGIFFGAAMSELRGINDDLRMNNQLLLISNAELSLQKEKCLDLAERLIEVQEHERARISMDFHDDLGQRITAIKTNLGVVQKMNSDEGIERVLTSTTGLANDLYEAAYAIMYQLRPHVIGELGLRSALTNGPVAQSLRSANIAYTPSVEGDLGKLDVKKELAIYRIAQECVNNAIKHSGATEVSLNLSVEQNTVYFSIRDNGTGIQPAAGNAGARKGYGLQGLEDRAYLMGAHYSLESGSSGTTHALQFSMQ